MVTIYGPGEVIVLTVIGGKSGFVTIKVKPRILPELTSSSHRSDLRRWDCSDESDGSVREW
jgi:hypothetical protein